MMVNQKKIDVTSNNLLNTQTPGYKAERATTASFEMEMMTIRDADGQRVLGDGVGSPITGIRDLQTLFEQGPIEATERRLDLAINGEGFFNILGEDGVTYLTRKGGFDLDAQGYLVLPGVGRVIGTGGYIRAMSSDVRIEADGTVRGANGAYLGTILITAPQDYAALARTESGLFISPDALPQSAAYQLLQGSLEQSNVDMNVELTNLIANQRAFQGCSTALTTIDSMNRKAVQQLASV